MFKDKLVQLRLAKGVTQAEIAHSIGVSPATIGNYEQGTRIPRNQEVWNKLAEYFEVSIDYLQEHTEIPYTSKQQHAINVHPSSKKPPKKQPFHQYLQYRTDIPIFFNGVNISTFVFSDDETLELTDEQFSSYIMFDIQSNLALFARRMLLTILYDIKAMSYDNLVAECPAILEKLENFVIYNYRKIWNNIDKSLPKADSSLESLQLLLSACITIDKIAQNHYTLVPLDDNFDWLPEKFCKTSNNG